MKQTLLILLITFGFACLIASAEQMPKNVASVPPKELRLVQKFFEAKPWATNEFATVIFDKETYLIVMDGPHRRAAILNRDPDREKNMGEVAARGFFSKDSTGAWVRDTREEFEMGGGIWMLDRFLNVLKKGETVAFTKFKWSKPEKGAAPEK